MLSFGICQKKIVLQNRTTVLNFPAIFGGSVILDADDDDNVIVSRVLDGFLCDISLRCQRQILSKLYSNFKLNFFMLKKLYSSSREPLKKYRDYNKTTGNSIIHIHFMIKHAYICIHEPCLRFSCNLLLLHVLPSFLSRDLQTFGVCCKQRFMSLSFCHLRGVIFLASSFTHHSLVG